jgi:hypothetical protein
MKSSCTPRTLEHRALRVNVKKTGLNLSPSRSVKQAEKSIMISRLTRVSLL